MHYLFIVIVNYFVRKNKHGTDGTALYNIIIVALGKFQFVEGGYFSDLLSNIAKWVQGM